MVSCRVEAWHYKDLRSTLYTRRKLSAYLQYIQHSNTSLMAATQDSTQSADSASEAFRTSGTRPGTAKPLITVGLTPSPLDIPGLLDTVKDPRAGAVVFFAGTPPPSPSFIPPKH